jgi:hypothetical protein
MRSPPQPTERTGSSPAPQPQDLPNLSAEQAAFAKVLGHLLAEAWRNRWQEATGSPCDEPQPTPQSVEPAG